MATTVPLPTAVAPVDVKDGKDWLRLTSGEWLRGKIEYLDRQTLVFDSEELDELKLDWDDVASSSDASARPATSPSTVSADATLQENLSLAAALLAKLGDNLALAEDLQREIHAEAMRSLPIRNRARIEPPRSEHLSAMFRVMRADD